ncbi:ester cyclase [Haloarchaeobius sp. DFWS5]|uniref:ester cyclase n=1 Tax=Haloarchaeobius sp. DFWS5 TaxID=3446114 RepID=UPI003EC0A022
MPTVTPTAQTVREKREHACRFFEHCWRTGRLDTELVTEEYRAFGLPGGPHDIDTAQAAIDAVRNAIPNLRVVVRAVICEGDFASIRFGAQGTQTGDLAGVSGDGDELTTDGVVTYAFENGRIAESRLYLDVPSLLCGRSDSVSSGDSVSSVQSP